MGIAEDLIIIIIAGLFVGVIANKLKTPPIVGFIVAGIIIGPHTGGITVSDIPRIELLAEIGVALLLFSIGLDFSFGELKAVKGIAILGTPIQVILLIAMGILMGHSLGFSFLESAVFGMVISLSSTMVVIKTLMSRGLIGTLSSSVMIGILIVQDLAAIPLMLVIPNLGSLSGGITPLLFTLLKAGGILLVLVVIGMRAIPWILKFVARLNSRELFLITITAIGLGVGYVTHIFGLSLAFGAFLAGMVINESEYSHQALNDIIPLRDIFGLVFFTSVGMLLDVSFIREHIPTIALLVLLVILVKFTVFSLLSLSFRYFNIIPLALGLGLAQVGEFSFVLARTAMKNEIIDYDFFSLILAVSVVTMLVSPFVSMLAAPLYSLKKRFFSHEEFQTKNLPSTGMAEHIVIAGGGRVGSQLARIFSKIGFSFIVIEQDFRRFERCKKSGLPVIYGDAGQEVVLQASKVDKAKLMIITVPFIATAKEITKLSYMKNPEIKIIARADDNVQLNDFFEMNIFEVVQPEFEASLEILRQALDLLEVPSVRVHELVDDLRKQNDPDFTMEKLDQARLDRIFRMPGFLDISWFEVNARSRIAGKSLGELSVRAVTGASIVGVFRDDHFTANPNASFLVKEGDCLAVMGTQEQKRLFREKKLGD